MSNPVLTEDRFYAVWAEADDDCNRLRAAQEAVGFPVVGIVDENDGGVVAYVHVDYETTFIEALKNA